MEGPPSQSESATYPVQSPGLQLFEEFPPATVLLRDRVLGALPPITEAPVGQNNAQEDSLGKNDSAIGEELTGETRSGDVSPLTDLEVSGEIGENGDSRPSPSTILIGPGWDHDSRTSAASTPQSGASEDQSAPSVYGDETDASGDGGSQASGESPVDWTAVQDPLDDTWADLKDLESMSESEESVGEE